MYCQQMVNYWFGLLLWDSTDIPKNPNSFHFRRSQRTSNHQAPNQQSTNSGYCVCWRFVATVGTDICCPSLPLGCWIALATASLAVVLGIAVARGQRTELRVQFCNFAHHARWGPGPQILTEVMQKKKCICSSL